MGPSRVRGARASLTPSRQKADAASAALCSSSAEILPFILFYSPKDTAKVTTNPDAPKSVSGIQTHFARLLLYVSSCASNFISTSILSTFRWRLKEIGNKY